MCAHDSPNNSRDRNTEAAKQEALLLKEMEETNNWARLGAQLYFGWFALQFTVNGIAIGWLTQSAIKPPFNRLVFAIFIGWNLMGTITTFFIRKHILDCDSRITE